MPKLILNGAGSRSNIELDNDHANVTFSGGYTIVSEINGVSKVGGIDSIEVQNNHSLYIKASKVPITDLVAVGASSIILHNNYTGTGKTDIKVGNNSNVSLSGTDLPIGSVTLEPTSNFIFCYNACTYYIKGSGYEEGFDYDIYAGNIVFHDNSNIYTLAKLSKFLEREFCSPKTEIELNKVAGLRAYEKVDKELIDLFMHQNGVACNRAIVASFLQDNYFWLTGIAFDLIGSDFDFSIEIVGAITSHLNLSDVDLT